MSSVALADIQCRSPPAFTQPCNKNGLAKRRTEHVRKIGLVPQILIGVVLGALVGTVIPGAAERLGILGQLFVGMLKAVAPLLVMVLVMSAIANRHESGLDGRKAFLTIGLYLL